MHVGVATLQPFAQFLYPGPPCASKIGLLFFVFVIIVVIIVFVVITIIVTTITSITIVVDVLIVIVGVVVVVRVITATAIGSLRLVCPPAGSRVYGKILLCLCVEMLKCTHIFIHRERETEIEIRWIAQSVDVLCVGVSFATKGKPFHSYLGSTLVFDCPNFSR